MLGERRSSRMRLQRFINRILGRPGAFDVDAVTSVLMGRELVSERTAFRGFESPPGRF